MYVHALMHAGDVVEHTDSMCNRTHSSQHLHAWDFGCKLKIASCVIPMLCRAAARAHQPRRYKGVSSWRQGQLLPKQTRIPTSYADYHIHAYAYTPTYEYAHS